MLYDHFDQQLKPWFIIDAVLVTYLKHSTIRATMKEMNFIATRPSTCPWTSPNSVISLLTGYQLFRKWIFLLGKAFRVQKQAFEAQGCFQQRHLFFCLGAVGLCPSAVGLSDYLALLSWSEQAVLWLPVHWNQTELLLTPNCLQVVSLY